MKNIKLNYSVNTFKKLYPDASKCTQNKTNTNIGYYILQIK